MLRGCLHRRAHQTIQGLLIIRHASIDQAERVQRSHVIGMLLQQRQTGFLRPLKLASWRSRSDCSSLMKAS